MADQTTLVDKNPQCYAWANRNPSECTVNPSYMLVNCAKSCYVVEENKRKIREAEEQRSNNEGQASKFSDYLKKNKINPESLMKSIEQVVKKVTCTGECAKNEIRNILRQELELARTAVQDDSAQKRLDAAESKFNKFEYGEDGNDKMLFLRYSATADEFKRKTLAAHEAYKKDITVLVNQYAADTKMAYRVEELFVVRLAEYVEYKRRLEYNNRAASTLGRKVAYVDHDGAHLLVVRKMILFVYFVILFSYLIFGPYFGKQQFRNKVIWWFIFVYVFFPLVSYKLSIDFFRLTHWLTHVWSISPLPNKNVYLNL
jgi:hypothetical protein